MSTIDPEVADELKIAGDAHFAKLADKGLFEYLKAQNGLHQDYVDWGKGYTMEEERIAHPAHYTKGKIECIEAIKAALTEEEFRGYIKGNVIKYSFRERYKAGIEDLKKARWYLDYLINLQSLSEPKSTT